MQTATAQSLERRATYQDVLDAPEHLIAEIIDGELILSPRPAPLHGQTSSVLGAHVTVSWDGKTGGPADRPGGWWIHDEPELHLGKHVLVPDIAGWRRERLPVLPNTAYWDIAPDWVCEIISSASAGRDRVRKARIYAAHQIGYLWLVDPLARTLEVYHLIDGRWDQLSSHIDDEKVRAEPFAAVELDMSAWWLPAPTELDETSPDRATDHPSRP